MRAIIICKPIVGAKAAHNGCNGPAFTVFAEDEIKVQIGMKAISNPTTIAAPTSCDAIDHTGSRTNTCHRIAEGSGGDEATHTVRFAQ
mmetsp:Transcript_123220/g.354053  ORF Transcript_123220/g.354053 Transcript_123220/m.354053 type:complete len:88 (-) Transcript_123220:122-385(-)